MNQQKKEKGKSATLPAEKAVQCIRNYYAETERDGHARYLSWQHCYQAFCRYRDPDNQEAVDYLALHLAFYLASWGMYRGSSFLLQKDYKVHIPVVEMILKEKYNPLLGITAEGLTDEKNLDLLDEISDGIRCTYAKELPAFEGKDNNATDTLVTKILLGTLGCVPAYDRYYKQTVKKDGISSGRYNRKSVRDVANYYCTNSESFEDVRAKLSAGGIEYPQMKLMDMCMWQVAFEDEEYPEK